MTEMIDGAPPGIKHHTHEFKTRRNKAVLTGYECLRREALTKFPCLQARFWYGFPSEGFEERRIRYAGQLVLRGGDLSSYFEPSPIHAPIDAASYHRVQMTQTQSKCGMSAESIASGALGWVRNPPLQVLE